MTFDGEHESLASIEAFTALHQLENEPKRIVAFLYAHRDDSGFWKKGEPHEDVACRAIIEADDQGRPKTVVRAFAQTHEYVGKLGHYGFSYEEWTYNEPEGTITMRQQSDLGKTHLLRIYKNGEMTEEQALKEYPGGDNVLHISRPLSPLGNKQFYATVCYKPEKVVQGYKKPDPYLFHPVSQIVIKPHTNKGEPVKLKDVYTALESPGLSGQVISIKDALNSNHIQYSSPQYMESDRRAPVSIRGEDFVVNTDMGGDLVFPQSLKIDEAKKLLKF